MRPKQRALGIAGFCFRARDPRALARWYFRVGDPERNPSQLWKPRGKAAETRN